MQGAEKQVTIAVNVRFNLTFWQALKLRLAGVACAELIEDIRETLWGNRERENVVSLSRATADATMFARRHGDSHGE